MRTTITIDDTLFQRALDLADPSMERSDVFRVALNTFIRVQAGK